MTRQEFFVSMFGTIGLFQKKEKKPSFALSTEPIEYWTYEPQADVTIQELALLMPLFMGIKPNGSFVYMTGIFKKYPMIERHFKHFGGAQ